ncbi:MAG TPA: PKD domain-containing protein, partial [Chitinophagales bacterium]|nr:PKD domain-containing protein [Chitinophagales bacterium]
RDTHPEIELYIGDGSHPSAAGSYAAACTFYAAIFRNDPTLITYDFTLPADQAHIIREATKLVVYDSLASWYIGTYIHEPIANFNVNTGIPFTASFENLSENAISYLWNFGDGTNSTEAAPVHIYGAEGMYIVSLEVTGCSDVDDYTSDITITGVETSIQNNAIINWQPENPVHAELFLPANNSNWRIEILDMAGNVVMQTYAQTLITVDGIHAGAYIIYLQQGDERMYRKLMIQ